jgi:hypothetical protein
MLKACLIVPKDIDIEAEHKLYMQAKPGTFTAWLISKGAHYASPEELAQIPLEDKTLTRKEIPQNKEKLC